MKRVYLILAIASLLVVLALGEYFAVNNVLNHMKESVAELKTQYYSHQDDITPLSNNILEIKNYWDEREGKMCLMFNHKDLGDITDALSKLLHHTENNDYNNAIVEVNLLANYTNKSHHIMSFNIHNIL